MAETIWLCPAVISMTAAEVAAALYAFSELMDDVPEATGSVVRDELSFIVSRYGMAAIECAADWLATKEGPLLAGPVVAMGWRLDGTVSQERLAWCHKQVVLALGGASA